MKSILLIFGLALGISIFFVFYVANDSIYEHSVGDRSAVLPAGNKIREDFQTRIIKIQQNLEDGKEVLRNTLYQESLRSKKSISATATKPRPTDQTIKLLSMQSSDHFSQIVPPIYYRQDVIASEHQTDNIELPGASKHPILNMNDQIFRRTAISEMMSAYGEADGGGSCSIDFGNSLVNRWRETKAEYCSQSKSTSTTLIECYLVHQTRHHGDGDNLCLMHNVSVNMGLFGDDSIVRPVVEHYVKSKHFDQPYIRFPHGFIKADCELNEKIWQPPSFPGWNLDWTVNSVRIESPQEIAQQCDEWVEHPVLIVQRDTFANFFHDSEDLINAFLALAILKWNVGDTQLYFTDLYPEGPFWPIWKQAYGGGKAAKHPPLTAWDLRQQFGTDRNKELRKNHRVCYRKLAIGIYGPAAPMTVASWDTPCSRTALIRAYSDFIIRGMGLHVTSHYALSRPSDTIRITYMARRASTEWPEKKFCNDTHSFFLCHFWSHMGVRTLGRMVQNDQDVVQGLKKLESRVFKNGARVVVKDVDYNLLTLEQQLQCDLDTDIMVGPHGAGLMHNIFMRDRGVLIEMFVDGSSVNRHFHNLAHWFGRKYIGRAFGNPVDVRNIVEVVAGAVEGINLSSY